MYEKNAESEIVIKITPRNLERLIYILIIIGLAIFAIVEFNIKTPDCPAVQCNATNATAVATAPAVTETPAEEPETETPAAEEEEEITESSGKVDFLLTDIKLCIINETLDRGRFDTITIYAKNGLDRTLNARIDLYLWDENDDDALRIYPAQKIDKIKIIAGNTYTHTYTMTGGMFTELDVGKTVKAVLVDTDLSKEITEQIKTDLEATADC